MEIISSLKPKPESFHVTTQQIFMAWNDSGATFNWFRSFSLGLCMWCLKSCPRWMSDAWVMEHLDQLFHVGLYSGWISLFQGLLVATFWTFLLSTERGREAGVWFKIPLPWWCETRGLTQPSLVLVMWCLHTQHCLQLEPFLVCFTWESRRNYALACKFSLGFTTPPGSHW